MFIQGLFPLLLSPPLDRSRPLMRICTHHNKLPLRCGLNHCTARLLLLLELLLRLRLLRLLLLLLLLLLPPVWVRAAAAEAAGTSSTVSSCSDKVLLFSFKSRPSTTP